MKVITNHIWVGTASGTIRVFDYDGKEIATFDAHNATGTDQEIGFQVLMCPVDVITQVDQRVWTGGGDAIIHIWKPIITHVSRTFFKM